MVDEVTSIRIRAVDETASATKQASDNIRRIGEATRAAMGTAQAAAQGYTRSVEEAARRAGRSAQDQQRQIDKTTEAHKRAGREAETSGKKQQDAHDKAARAAGKHGNELQSLLGRYIGVAAAAESARKAFLGFADQDERIRRMANQAGVANDEVRKLIPVFRDLARVTGQTTEDMIEGFDMLRERAHLTIPETKELFNVISKGAYAAGVSTKEYAEVFGSLMVNMKVTRHEAATTADIIQKGINDNQIEIQEFTRQIPKLTEQFSHWGITGAQGVATMMALLGKLKEATGNTGLAAQSLGMILEKAFDPKVANALGYSSEGLQRHLARMTAEGKNSAVEFFKMLKNLEAEGVDIDKLFGFRIRFAIRKALEEVDKLDGAIKDAANATGTLDANVRNLGAGPKKSVDELISSFKSLANTAGELMVAMGANEQLQGLVALLNILIMVIEKTTGAMEKLKTMTGGAFDVMSLIPGGGILRTIKRMPEIEKALRNMLEGQPQSGMDIEGDKPSPYRPKQGAPSGIVPGSGADHRGGTVTPTNPNPAASDELESAMRREANLQGRINVQLDESVVLLRDFNRYLDQTLTKMTGTRYAALGDQPTTSPPGVTPAPTSTTPPVVTPRTSPDPRAPKPPDAGPAPPPTATPPPQTTTEPVVNPPTPYVPPAPRKSPADILRGPSVAPAPAQNHNDLPRAKYDAMFRDTPLANSYDKLAELADKHNMPMSLLGAIMAQETGQGRKFKNNNPFSVSGSGGAKKMATLDEGLERGVAGAAKLYKKHGGGTDKFDFDGFAEDYAPTKGATNDSRNLNRFWKPGVTKFADQLRGDVQPTQVAGPPAVATPNPPSQAPIIAPSAFTNKPAPPGDPLYIPGAQGPATPIPGGTNVTPIPQGNQQRVSRDAIQWARVRAAQGDTTVTSAPTSIGVARTIEEALKLEGLNENRDKQALQDYMRTGKNIASDQNPWCASFVNTLIERAGGTGTKGDFDVKGGKSWWAKDFLKWGDRVKDDPRALDVIVWGRGSAGHVSSFTGQSRVDPKTGQTEYQIIEGNVGGSRSAGHTGKVGTDWLVRNKDGTYSRKSTVAGGGKGRSLDVRRGQFPPDQDPVQQAQQDAKPNAPPDTPKVAEPVVDPKPGSAQAAPPPAPTVEKPNPPSQAPQPSPQEVTPLAGGGRASAGGGYIVGERGPEWFSPGESGYVSTNERLNRELHRLRNRVPSLEDLSPLTREGPAEGVGSYDMLREQASLRPIMSRTDYDNPGATARFARATMRREADREVREARWDSYSDIGAA